MSDAQDIDELQPYDQRYDTEIPEPYTNNYGVNGLYRPSAEVQRVRIVPSDALGYQTIPIPDSTAALPQQPVTVTNRKQNGTAARLYITIIPLVDSTSRVFLLKAAEDMGTILLDTTGRPYLSNGYFLGTANLTSALGDGAGRGFYEVVTTEHLYAVSLNTVAGTGALISFSAETFYSE